MKLRRFAQGLQALLFALGRRHPFRGPAKLAWEVTEACNSRCRTCTRRKASPEGELSTEEGFALIDSAAELGTLSISFTGGEPLIRKDLPELVARAHQKSLHTSLSTNGLLLNGKRLQRLLSAGIDTIYLSLDGATAKTNDQLRGVPGSHDRVLEAAQAVLSRQQGGKPRVFFNMTISRANMRELPQVAELTLANSAAGLTIQPAQVFDQVGLAPDPDLTLSTADAAELDSMLGAVVTEYPALIPLPSTYLSDMSDFVREPPRMLEIPCVAGYLHAVVGSTGSVYPCPVEFASMGSVKGSSLREIWFGERAHTVRSSIARGDHPPCWFNCVVPASIVLSELVPFGWARFLFSPAGKHLLRRIRGGDQ
jgi:MoaA/NifB/PqqE/SkfB family radical SAM enzyme